MSSSFTHGGTGGKSQGVGPSANLPAILPGINNYLRDNSEGSDNPPSSDTTGIASSLPGTPKHDAANTSKDSPQNNSTQTTPTINNDSGSSTTTHNTAADAANPDFDPNDPRAPIEIVVQENDNQVVFRIRKDTKMGKVMTRYAEANSRNKGALKFLFDGQKIFDHDTPSSLEMVDGEVIDVFMEQLGR